MTAKGHELGNHTPSHPCQGKTEREEQIDLYDIGSYVVTGQSGEELIGLVKDAIQKKGLVVFLFHGVGGE